MPGIPTLYRGVQFRSRLEARYAAFFDLLGYGYQYEPFDLEGWIPDFIVKLNFMGPFADWLVEVKPDRRLQSDTASKTESSSWNGNIWVTNCSVTPLIHDECDLYLVYMGAYCTPKSRCRDHGRWDHLLVNAATKECAKEYMDFWNEAGNLTQWKGKQSICE